MRSMQCAGFPAFPDRSLLVRALAQGCSEKQRVFKLITQRPTTKPRRARPAPYQDSDTTLSDLREAAETLEDVSRLWKRVFGEAHPETQSLQSTLAAARVALAARAA